MEDVYRRIKLMMNHFEEQTEILEKRLIRLEHGARQPRLAMEADGQADTETRERTEGAATAVQAMRWDCFSARRFEPGPNTNSTSFGVKAGPPALPCRDDGVVESGAAAFESCFPSMEMRSSTAGGGLVPTGKASKASETTSNQPPLRFCSTEETDLEAKNSWTSISSASYDSTCRGGTCLLLPIAGGSLTQNPGKIRPLIQAVRKVTSAPAHFWDRGARWFVARFYALGQLETSYSVFLDEIRWLFEKRPVLMPRQDKVSPSRAARGYRNSREDQRSFEEIES